MNWRLFYKMSAICVVLACAAGCNSDLFVDGMDIAPVTHVTIQGDGGDWRSTFVRDGLDKISIDPQSSSESQYFRYFDRNNREVDADCPASELASIVFENEAQYYSIGFGTNMIYISSDFNALEETMVRVWLEYESGATRLISLTIEAGKQLEFGGAWYEGDIEVEDDVKQTIHTSRFSNDGPIAQLMEIRPYYGARCADIMIPSENWAYSLTYDMTVLAYLPWGWARESVKDITLGQQREFTPSWLEAETFTLEVPAHTKAAVTYTVHYSRASQSGMLLFFGPDSRSFEVPFTCKAVYPTSYDYTVEYEEL